MNVKENDYRVNVALKILKGVRLDEEEYNYAIKQRWLDAKNYRSYVSCMYKDDERTSMINLDRKAWLQGKPSMMGLYPTELKKEYLTPDNLKVISSAGWKVEEIGSEL
jgi:hypothetical protein